MHFYYVEKKTHFFKNPPFKFEKLLVGYYHRVWPWKTYIRSLLNFFSDWKPYFELCEVFQNMIFTEI